MNSLRDRLARLLPQGARETEGEPSLRARLRTRARRAQEGGFSDLPGALEETLDGPLHVRRKSLPPSHHHGMCPLDGALAADGRAVAALALDRTLADFDPAGALYLDTETTGLAGGTGTLPFLIGTARFEGRSVVSEQIFLREPADEPVALRTLARHLERATHLVTFNGKSFDWPLLRTRFVLARLPQPAPMPHFDLLHAARRVYKHRLGGCRLTALESEVLGFIREEDVPGSMIPTLYLDFLASGVAEPLAGVFEHNAHDLVAMVALVGDLVAAYGGAPGHPPEDFCALGQIAFRARDLPAALTLLEAAGDLPQALILRARLVRRVDPLHAKTLLERALPMDPEGYALLELAKLCEHRLRDFTAALPYAREAAKRGVEPVDRGVRREMRLQEKLARATASPRLEA